MTMKRFTILLVSCCILSAQTRINLGRDAQNPDFSGLAHTRPIQVGALLPQHCATGELFFLSSAPTGRNLFVCSSTDNWNETSASSIGGCTLDSNNNLVCPGGVGSGDGTQAGRLSLYELVANGNKSITVVAPDHILTPYSMALPNTPPAAGQILTFGAPDNSGRSQGSWTDTSTAAATFANQRFTILDSSGNASRGISLSAPSTVNSYTLQLPQTSPLAGQTLTFGSPDSNGLAVGSWSFPASGSGGGSSGGSTVLTGGYSSLPGSCGEGDLFLFTDSFYGPARCTSGSWQHVYQGRAINPPSTLTVTSALTPSGSRLVTTYGAEQLVVNGGTQGAAFRTFPVSATAPYTRYFAFLTPMFLDNANYRLWHAGFADSSGNLHVLTCGVGQAAISGFWCRISRLSANGSFAGADTSLLVFPSVSGPVYVALGDDGSQLHFGLSTDGRSYFQIAAVPRLAFLSAPTQFAYGLENSGAGQDTALTFLGVLR